jgi:ornithine cyclodeaminase
MPRAIEAVRAAFADGAVVPPRAVLATGAGHTLVMPAWLPGSRDLAVKVVSVVSANPERGLPRIVGLVVAFDPDTGAPLALLPGPTVTALRTGAVSGLATSLLARPDAEVLAVLGAGALARDQIAAVAAVRPIRQIRVYAPTRAHAEAVARDAVGARAVASAAEAVRGADVVVTATPSTTPVLDDADLAAGVHLCAVGSWRPDMQEIPAATMRRARVFVDDRHAALAESGDLARAGDVAIAGDLRELLAGVVPGRTSPDQVTLFESVGLASEDAALVGVAVREALTRGFGRVVDGWA